MTSRYFGQALPPQERLIKKWPKLVNLFDFKKKTPLLLAAHNGDALMVNVLLEAGADATCLDLQGNSPMDLALASGASGCVEVLRTRERVDAN